MVDEMNLREQLAKITCEYCARGLAKHPTANYHYFSPGAGEISLCTDATEKIVPIVESALSDARKEWERELIQAHQLALDMVDHLQDERDRLQAQLSAATERADKMRSATMRQNEEICQTLGKVLGYPWFKDDPRNFPGATEADGVCVGDHVAESLAMEAVNRITQQAERERALREAGNKLLCSLNDYMSLASEHELVQFAYFGCAKDAKEEWGKLLSAPPEASGAPSAGTKAFIRDRDNLRKGWWCVMGEDGTYSPVDYTDAPLRAQGGTAK